MLHYCMKHIEMYTKEFHETLAKKYGEAGQEDLQNITDINQVFGEHEETIQLRKTLIQEEVGELLEALDEEDPAHIAKEAVDVMYVTAAIFSLYGWDYEEAVRRVAKNNQAKIEKGSVREDGKLVKPEEHPRVDMKSVVE